MVFVTDTARPFLHFLGFMSCVTCGIYVPRYITNHANEMEFGMELILLPTLDGTNVVKHWFGNLKQCVHIHTSIYRIVKAREAGRRNM